MIRFVLVTVLVLAACSSSAAGTSDTPAPTCPAATPLICSGTIYCCASGSPFLCGGKCWATQPTPTQCNDTAVVCGGTTGDAGSSGGACQSGSYCYEWNCNGDAECLATNPNGTATGADDVGNDPSCMGLLTFGQKFWNIPPATQSCTLTP